MGLAFPCALRAETAADPQFAVEDVEPGFKNLFKPGEWAPLWLTLRSSTDQTVRIVIDAPDPDDNVATTHGPQVDLKAGVPSRVEASFRSGRMKGELQVRILDAAGQVLARRRLRTTADSGATLLSPLRLDVPLWLTLGKTDVAGVSSGSEETRESRPATGQGASAGPRAARFNSPDELPRDFRLMESVEMLILPTGKAAGGGRPLIEQVSPAAGSVIREWVRMGGHLLLSVGAEVDAYRNSPLADWVPVAVEGQVPFRQLSSLEGFTGLHAPLRFAGTVQGARLGKVPVENVVLRDAGSPGPLIVSLPYGFGRVTVLALDLDAPPLVNWKVLRNVLEKLAGASPRTRQSAPRRTGQQLTHVGVTDLATQFLQTNEDFPAVRRSSYWSVLGWVLVYLAVIGPLDFLFVQRVLRRPEWTWMTLALLACAGVGLGAWQAGRGQARTAKLNQFDLVDVDTQTNAVRAETWASLYSPGHRRFSVALEPRESRLRPAPSPALSGEPVRISWAAPPENSLGGLYYSAASIGGRTYAFAPGGAAIENLPIPQWSTKTLQASWMGELEHPVIDSSLESAGVGQLQGSLRHHLAGPLEDCLLVVAGWAYLPTLDASGEATLAPEREWRPTGKNVRQRDLKALLTGEKRARRNNEETFSTEILTTTEPYNPLNRSHGQQLAMISFHDVAGGTEYTGLLNAAFRALELSDLMRLGRGVLIGRLSAPQSRAVIDGDEAAPVRQLTWVRFVLPIRQSERAVERILPKAGDAEVDRSFPRKTP